jgi:predicted enzyme related to lactoylglutathione lyase
MLIYCITLKFKNMTKVVSFFEIPAANFERAVSFYQTIFNVKIEVADCGEKEQMGFFPENEGAISFSEHIKPSSDGVLLSLRIDSIDKALAEISKSGGKTVIEKTAIQSENLEFFAVFIDSEGNKIGLHER